MYDSEQQTATVETVLAALRAAAEPTRLRILALCAGGELTVSELVRILGQSQPRVSRHLKLLVDAGLLDRVREGSWVFHRLAHDDPGGAMARHLIALLPDGAQAAPLDMDRLAEVKRERALAAAAYFRRNAARWDDVRSLYVEEAEVEAVLRRLLPRRGVRDLVDIGTGTGRMLEVFASQADRVQGIDLSPEMLAVARTNLERAGITNGQVRKADMYRLPFASDSFDAATIHQVLHFADDPGKAIAEAARVLRPSGRLLVADFAPHGLEFLRDEHEHRRLGFSDSEVAAWFKNAHLKVKDTIHLPGNPLTVTVWLGVKPRRRAAAAARRRRPGEPEESTDMDAQNISRGGAAGDAATVLAVAAPLPRDVEVSFEFFPPKTEESERTLWASIQRLAPLRPAYVSVTYGAGGSTRQRTHATVMRMLRDTDLTPAAHLTCVGHSRGEIDAIAAGYWEGGVRHIVALRGDAPEMGTAWQAHPDGHAHASQLVAALKKVADFEISVAAYPEKHPEASSLDADIDFLKRKIDAGASRAITQYFFDVDVYLRFVDRARARGVDVPIVPGILPVTNFKTVVRFSKMSGVGVPAWLADLFEGLDEEPATRKLVAASVAAEQCRVLHANGVKQFHFYTLNRADLAHAICHVLGVRAPKSHKTQRDQI